MAKTIRLTVAQALVKFLNNQYIEFDGKENKMFEGIFSIFGHGNVVGMGQALEEDAGDLIMRMGRNEHGHCRRHCYCELHSRFIFAGRHLRGPSTRSCSSTNGAADQFSNHLQRRFQSRLQILGQSDAPRNFDDGLH